MLYKNYPLLLHVWTCWYVWECLRMGLSFLSLHCHADVWSGRRKVLQDAGCFVFSHMINTIHFRKILGVHLVYVSSILCCKYARPWCPLKSQCSCPTCGVDCILAGKQLFTCQCSGPFEAKLCRNGNSLGSRYTPRWGGTRKQKNIALVCTMIYYFYVTVKLWVWVCGHLVREK